MTFNSLKEALVEDARAAYFDVNKTIDDASPLGLDSIPTQSSLLDVESHYSQTEREALGIFWSCEHFDQYLEGNPQFTIITDHELLLAIWKKPRLPFRTE